MELPSLFETVVCEIEAFEDNIPLALLTAESNSGSASTVLTTTRGEVVLASNDPFQVGWRMLELEVDRAEERRLLVNVWSSFMTVSLCSSSWTRNGTATEDHVMC